jgi:hypothetical protein
MRQARLPYHVFDLLVDMQCDDGEGSVQGGVKKSRAIIFSLMAWQRPKYLALQATNKIKIQHCMQKEFWAWRGGREEKRNENKG